MNNVFLRFFSGFILAPLFIFFLYNHYYSIFFLILIIIFASFYEIYKNVNQKFLSIFLYLLIFLFSYSLIELRGSKIENFIELCWLLSIIWLSDIGGYIVGKLLGGKKLTKFSPKKTISGLIGSIIFSQFSILIPIYFMQAYKINLSDFLLQIVICLITVFGDIFFSYIKRINNIKDYSQIIPGHGGILDRIDGMIFAVIAYFIFKNLL